MTLTVRATALVFRSVVSSHGRLGHVRENINETHAQLGLGNRVQRTDPGSVTTVRHPVPTVGEPAQAYFALDCVDVRNNMVWSAAEVAFWTVSSHPSAPAFRQMALMDLAYWTTIYFVEC